MYALLGLSGTGLNHEGAKDDPCGDRGNCRNCRNHSGDHCNNDKNSVYEEGTEHDEGHIPDDSADNDVNLALS